jgi:energy-coupling factor transport system permease protein
MENKVSMYVARESGLHSLHPLTKSLLVILLFVAGFAFPIQWISYFIFALIIIPLAIWGKILGELLNAVWKVSLPIAISVVTIQTLFWGEGTVLFEIWGLSPKREGLIFALVSIGRIVLTMGDLMLFTMTVRPDFLMISLKQIGMPSSLAYVVVTTLQIVPSFQRKASTILDAQRSRGLETEGNLVTRTKALMPVILPLVLGSLVEVEERAIAIEARAFNSTKHETSLIEIPDTPLQKNFRVGMMSLIIFYIIFGIAWRL